MTAPTQGAVVTGVAPARAAGGSPAGAEAPGGAPAAATAKLRVFRRDGHFHVDGFDEVQAFRGLEIVLHDETAAKRRSRLQPRQAKFRQVPQMLMGVDDRRGIQIERARRLLRLQRGGGGRAEAGPVADRSGGKCQAS